VDSAPAGSRVLKMMESSFDPAEASIAVNDIVMFTSGDDLIHALSVNGLPDVTVSDGISEFYQFEDPGTYTVVDNTTGATATIKVVGEAD
jgi:plastocyanin